MMQLAKDTKSLEYKGYQICMGSVYKDGKVVFSYFVPLGAGDGGMELGRMLVDQMEQQ
jgi:hypothetical protein